MDKCFYNSGERGWCISEYTMFGFSWPPKPFRHIFFYPPPFNFNFFLTPPPFNWSKAKRKAHNKRINTLSGLVHARECLRNLWTIDCAATDWTVWPYDSLLARKVSFHRSGKTLTQHYSLLFPLLQVTVRRAATWSPFPEWRRKKQFIRKRKEKKRIVRKNNKNVPTYDRTGTLKTS